MKNLKIERTSKSPEIKLSVDDSYALFEGRSIRSDSFTFYEPVINWFENYAGNSLKIDFKFEHINTSTNKSLLHILMALDKKVIEGKLTVSVSWYYDEDDEDMLETGEELEMLCDMKFKFFPTLG